MSAAVLTRSTFSHQRGKILERFGYDRFAAVTEWPRNHYGI